MTDTSYTGPHGHALLALSHLLEGPFAENRRSPYTMIEHVAPHGDRDIVGININWSALHHWAAGTARPADRVVVQAMRALAGYGAWPSLDTLHAYHIAHEVWHAVTVWHGCVGYWQPPAPTPTVVLGELEEVR